MTDGEDDAEDVAVLSFARQCEVARSADGWLQGRYYSDAGVSVRDWLSFRNVFEISPFEVGADRRAERRAFRERFARVARLLELDGLLAKAFQSLSNGEMRRVLFAQALLKAPKTLILEDPMAGLDPVRRERFRRIIAALVRDGIDVRVRGETDECGEWQEDDAASDGTARPVVELSNVCISFGRRRLFRNFSWTVREGERWILRGPNGSGKSTLLALITGDSPRAYANDVKVFGVKRGAGCELAAIRRRIGMVSPEMQIYLGRGPLELLEEALVRSPDLLLLDEPCLNLDSASSRRLCRRVASWLKRHPKTAAICVAHRPEHVPAGFTRTLALS